MTCEGAATTLEADKMDSEQTAEEATAVLSESLDRTEPSAKEEEQETQPDDRRNESDEIISSNRFLKYFIRNHSAN